jgi:DnaK suppressor protein
MSSKKPNKAAKRPAKAGPKKAAHKRAAAKKVARPQPKPVPRKPIKPAPKVIAAKPAPKAPRAKPAAPPKPEPALPKVAPLRPAPIRFDPRPLVMPPRAAQHDEDGDEPNASAGLLAGPRNVKPYIARRGEQYMNKEQLEHFARILLNWKRDLMVEVDRTVLHMKDEAANFPDPNDRATQEEEFSLELRTRDRERKLIRKIDEALKRIEDGSYGYCLETGEEIGIKRLEARPVATLSVEAQERRERREKQYGDRDDRYR